MSGTTTSGVYSDGVVVKSMFDSETVRVYVVEHPAIANASIEIRADYGQYGSKTWRIEISSASIKLPGPQFAGLYAYLWNVAALKACSVRCELIREFGREAVI